MKKRKYRYCYIEPQNKYPLRITARSCQASTSSTGQRIDPNDCDDHDLATFVLQVTQNENKFNSYFSNLHSAGSGQCHCLRHWLSAQMICSMRVAYAITSDTDMLNAPYSLFARYSLCTMQQGRPGRAQSLWIICSMLNNRARHATVCISNQLGNAQTIYFPNFFLFQKLQQFDYNLKKFTKYIFRQPFFRCIFSFSPTPVKQPTNAII